MSDWIWDHFPWLWFGFCAVAIPGFILIASLHDSNSSARYDSFRQHCAEAGGHIYAPDGTAWCLSGDGRIIEVYP